MAREPTATRTAAKNDALSQTDVARGRQACRPQTFAALRGGAAREYLIRHQGSDKTRREYEKSLNRFADLLSAARYEGDPQHVCEASMEAALTEMTGTRIREKGVAHMVKPGSLSTFVGRVKRGAELRSDLRWGSWRVTEAPGGTQLGKAVMTGYQQIYDGAVKAGRIEETLRTNETRALRAADIIKLWRATASETDRLLVRALSLTRVLLTRPGEILMQRAPSSADRERYARAGLAGRRIDGHGLPFIVVPGRHSKVAGSTHPALIWSDPRDGDPHGVLNPLDCWEHLTRAAGAHEFATCLIPGVKAGASTDLKRDQLNKALEAIIRRTGDTTMTTLDWYSGRHTAGAYAFEGGETFRQSQGHWGATNSKVPRTYSRPIYSAVAPLARTALRTLDGAAQHQQADRLKGRRGGSPEPPILAPSTGREPQPGRGATGGAGPEEAPSPESTAAPGGTTTPETGPRTSAPGTQGKKTEAPPRKEKRARSKDPAGGRAPKRPRREAATTAMETIKART